MNSYEDKIKREKDWYRHSHSVFRTGHFLNSRLFYSPERTAFNVHFCKTQFVRCIQEVLDRDHLANPRMLIAPTGTGFDLPYLLPLSQRVTGIDISADAMQAIADGVMEKHVGDIKHMTMFADNQFDVVIMSAFFHHFVKFGFDEFLLEALRVLRPGGHLFSFEPSILHPFCFAAWCGKKLFGNITGCVEDESPFHPGRLTAASYSHNRMPIPVARILHMATGPLRRAPLLKYFAWVEVFYGRKP